MPNRAESDRERPRASHQTTTIKRIFTARGIELRCSFALLKLRQAAHPSVPVRIITAASNWPSESLPSLSPGRALNATISPRRSGFGLLPTFASRCASSRHPGLRVSVNSNSEMQRFESRLIGGESSRAEVRILPPQPANPSLTHTAKWLTPSVTTIT